MKKKCTFRFLALSVLMMLFGSIKAQNPIVIQTVLTPPYPVYYGDFVKLTNLANIVVQNTDLQNSYTIRFRMELDGGNGINLTLPQSIIPVNPISLSPGEVKVLTNDDLQSIYQGIGVDNIELSGVDLQKVIESQRIPDGVYSLCIQAFDNETVKPLSMSISGGCSNKMIISTLEPPTIISPENNVSIDYSDPQQILFRWTAVHSPSEAMFYDIRIVEVPDGVNPYDAIRTDHLFFYEELDYPATIFNYGPAYPPMVSGKNYAVQITAHNASSNANIRNGGKSDVHTFFYKQPTKGAPPAFSCNSPCPPPTVVSERRLANQLSSGDEVKMGNFKMTVLDAHNTGQAFRGEGILHATTFMPYPVKLEFDDLQVNINYEQLDGTVKAKQKNELVEIACFHDQMGFTPDNDEDMDDIYNTVINPATAVTTFLNNPPSSGMSSGLEIPIGLGDNDRNIVITGMYFEKTGASINLVAGHKMIGDTATGEINLIFGSNQICYTPGGPAKTNGGNKLALLGAVDFYPVSNITIRFEPGNVAANSGCLANLDCGGIGNFQFEGTVKLDPNYLLPLNEQLEDIPNHSLGARFKELVLNPADIILPLEFEGTTTLENTTITPYMRASMLPDYAFKINKIFLDISFSSNPENIRLSPNETEGMFSPNQWVGVFIEDFNFYFPNYFNKNDASPLMVTANNFRLNEYGASFSVVGNDMLTDDQPGTFDQWKFTLNNYSLRVVKNDIKYCNLYGTIKMDISSGFVNYHGVMHESAIGPYYNLQLNTGEEIYADMWKTYFILDSSYVVGRVRGDSLAAEANISASIRVDNQVDGIEDIKLRGMSFTDLKMYSYPPYFEGAVFNLNDANGQKFGSINLVINDVNFESLQPNSGEFAKHALSFDVILILADMGYSYFTANSKIRLTAKKSNKNSDWEFDSVRVDRINMVGEIPLVEFEGYLDWYQNHPVYNNGFGGELIAYFFMKKLMVDAKAKMGSKDDYDYWYVDGAVTWDHDDIPLIAGLGVRGFGGGAFMNMERFGKYQAQTIGTLDETPPTHRPKKDKKGYRGLIIMESPFTPELVNGITELEVGFENDRLSSVALNADLGIMRPVPIGPDADYSRPMFWAEGTIDMHGSTNPEERCLDARLDYGLNIPKNPSVLWGSGSLSFYSGNDDWKLWIGDPTNLHNSTRGLMSTEIGIKYKVFGKTYTLSNALHSYFCFGTILPPMPRLPYYVPRSIKNTYIPRTNPTNNGSGAMMGLHKNFGMPRKKAFTVLGCGVKFRADAGLGMDLALISKQGMLCNERTDFGVNKFRASGKGYFYGTLSFDGSILGEDFTIAEKTAGVKMTAQVPNPMYMSAFIGGNIDLPIYGNYNYGMRFKAGEKCEYDVDEEYIQEQLAKLSMPDMIKDISLSSDQSDSVYINDDRRCVEAEMNMPLATTTQYTMGNGSILYSKVVFKAQLHEKINDMDTRVINETDWKHLPSRGNDVDSVIKVGGSSKKIKIYFKDNSNRSLLKPGKSYSVKYIAKIVYRFDNDPWADLTDSSGRVVKESKLQRFVTSERNPTRIEHVSYANPAINQRFFYVAENDGDEECYLTFDDNGVLNRFGDMLDILIEFKDLENGDLYVSGATKVPRQDKIVYTLPRKYFNVAGNSTSLPLAMGKIFEVKVKVRSRVDATVEPYQEIFTYYFRTSEYATYQDKLDDVEIDYRLYNASSPTHKYYKLKIKAKEGFGVGESFHLSYNRMQNINGQTHSWHNQYEDLRSYVFSNRIAFNSNSIKEAFIPNTSRYDKWGDLTMADIDDAQNAAFGLPNHSNKFRVRLEYSWNLNENLYGYWILKRNHLVGSKPRDNKPWDKQFRMDTYQTSPLDARVKLIINNDREVVLNLSRVN
jgi:hypothetical protein